MSGHVGPFDHHEQPMLLLQVEWYHRPGSSHFYPQYLYGGSTDGLLPQQ